MVFRKPADLPRQKSMNCLMYPMKSRVIILFVILGLFGCQSHSTAKIPVSVTPHAFKVALLLPRAVNADSWDRAGYDGLSLVEKELNAKVAYTAAIPEADFEKVFRQYAIDGYDFIIGHGNQFAASAVKVAAQFPHTAFAITGKYEGNNSNLGSLSLREGEMAYLFGAIAAIKTKTKRVGYLGGEDNISQREIITLYKRGVQALDPTVQVSTDLVGNFTDAAKAEQLAQKQINNGADIIFVLAGAAGMGVHAQAQQAGIFTLAWIEDLNYLAPRAILTSNVQNIAKMLLYGATLAKRGQWEGKQYKFGLAEGVQFLAPFRGLVSTAEERRIDSVRKDILSGKIDTVP